MLCKYCGKPFPQLEGGTKHYCTESCRNAAQSYRYDARKRLKKMEAEAARLEQEKLDKARKSESAQSESVIPMFNMSEFGDNINAEIDTFNDLNWIYRNIAVKDIKPADAPSPGAFAHLQYIQKNEQNMLDFYTKVYPRLIPAKSKLDSQGSFNDDNRELFDLLERIQKECEDGSGKVSVL